MSRALAVKFALSLAVVLILGQLQCVAACVSFFASQAADQNLPPCHRQHNSKHSGDSSNDACSHDISAAGPASQTVSSTAPTLAIVPVPILPQLVQALFHDASIPIAAPSDSSAPPILRI